MPDYSKAKIYKLITPSGLTYVGSSCEKTLALRKGKHKAKYNAWKRGTYHYITAWKLYDEDYDNVEIILLEKYPCEDKDELLQRERYHIEQHKCVNKILPSRRPEEYGKQWYEENKERIKEKNKKKYEENKSSSIKVTCECGSVIRNDGLKKHKTSLKHKAFLESIEN